MQVIPKNCIHCGHCIEKCDYGARNYYDDTGLFFEDLKKGKKISLMVAPSVKVNFLKDYKRLLGFLKHQGVNKIFDVSLGADICVWAYLKHINRDNQRAIAQPCPAIINYIETRLPKLIPDLMPVHSPLLCASIYAKKYKNVTDDLAFISPCIAKKDEISDPNTGGYVKYNVTYRKLQEYLEQNEINLADYQEAEYDSELIGLGGLFPKHGGLGENINYYTNSRLWIKQVEGEADAYSYLESCAARDAEVKPHLVDVLNCRLGCNFGSATTRCATSDEAEYQFYKMRMQKLKETDELENLFELFERTLDINDFKRNYKSKPLELVTATESEIEASYNRMSKFDQESRHINCQSCGFSSCREMAIAVHNGLNTEKNCLYYTRRLMMDEEIALATLEKVSEAKSDFLARMSHEIRTPMNAIIGMAELALRETMSESAGEHVIMIKQAGNNLLSIINDILDISKIEQGKLELLPTQYNFSSLINDVISIIRMKAIDSQLRFVVTLDPGIPNGLFGDELRIRQIMLNIVGNAFKYTNQGFVALTITGELTGEDEIVLRIEVADSGKGIKEEDVKKLFGDFVQIDLENNRGVEGTGLGLAIAKRLTTAMGGDIHVISEYGKGSTFTITLPQKIYSHVKIAAVEDAGDIDVLILERREIFRDSIKRSLDSLGVKSRFVKNDSDLFQELKSGTYNFVFMPVNFWVNVKKMRAKLDFDAKIILITEYGESVKEPGMTNLAMPLHVISIANVLSGKEKAHIYNGRKKAVETRFIAPEARVLIVDDIYTNLKVAEGLMLPYQMKIDLCKSGQEALQAVKRHHYDIIFMDHMMPEMDGVEVTAQIRAMEAEEYKKIPIIALTANAISGMKEMFLQNELNDFLAKPIEMVKLNAILEQWLPREKLIKSSHALVPEEENMPELVIAGIDVERGIARTGGTVDNYMQTLAVFYKDGHDKIAEINTCLERGDIHLYTTHVHALKSALGSIGAISLSRMAGAMEDAGLKENVEFIKRHNGVFAQNLGTLLDNIDHVLSSDKEEKGDKTFDISNSLNELLKLKQAFVSLDFDSINKISEFLEYQDYPEEIMKAMEAILESTMIGDYDNAISMIDRLVQRKTNN